MEVEASASTDTRFRRQNQGTALARRVRRGDKDVKAMRLFHGSISYLSLLFLVVAIDPFLG
mgnify:CR=1 FL=1